MYAPPLTHEQKVLAVLERIEQLLTNLKPQLLYNALPPEAPAASAVKKGKK